MLSFKKSFDVLCNLREVIFFAVFVVFSTYSLHSSFFYWIGSESKACYWTDSIRTDLDIPNGTIHANAAAITVDNGIVYTSGYYYMEFLKATPSYWINTRRTELPIPVGATSGYANNITVVNGTVYTAGTYTIGDGLDSDSSQKACYWTDTARTDLPVPNNARGISVSGITVENGTVYTVGFYNVDSGGSKYVPCYWIGTERVDLLIPDEATSGYANNITVVNGTVYTVGTYIIGDGWSSNSSQKACYWIGTTCTDLPIPAGAKTANASGITVVDGTVYTIGNYGDFPNHISRSCYWINTTRTDLPLPNGIMATNATEITIVNGAVYTAGTDFFGNHSWTGTVFVNLPIPSGMYRAFTSGTTLINGTVYTSGGYFTRSGQ
ncbi:MAG: hypothetical protein FWG89_08450 [Treponema sp.]|nr:hypothetical protein [Treponema sp.]